MTRHLHRRSTFLCLYAGLALLLLPLRVWAMEPPWIAPTVAELTMKSEPKAPGAPVVVLSYSELDDGDSAEVSVHVRLKILTSGGLDAGSVRMPDRVVSNDQFDQHIYARTIHADGTIIPFVRTKENSRIVTEEDGATHQVISMPSVQVGSVVEYGFHFASQDTLYTYLIGFYSPIWEVQREWFVRAAHFNLKTPANLPPEDTRWVANLPTGTRLERGHGHLTLDVADIPAAPDDEFMPPTSASLYRVRFFYHDGPVDKYWGKSGARVDDNWPDFYAPRKAIVAAVRELVLASDTDEVKLHKLYNVVQGFENTDLTRRHERVEDKKDHLHDAKNSEDIWNRKRGSSEELTMLYIALARAAGYKAYPIAVASRDKAVFDQNLMTWSQTDSLLAIVDVKGKEIFFDPGVRRCPFAQVAPWHANVLGVSTETKLVKIRYTPEEPFSASRIERVADLSLAPDGAVTGTLKVGYMGLSGLTLRRRAIREDVHEAEESLRKEMQEQVPAGVELKFSSLTGLDDPEVPLVAAFDVSGALGTATSKRVVLPAQFFAGAGKPWFVAETRTEPVAFPAAYGIRDQVMLHLPAQLEVESLPERHTLNLATDAGYSAVATPAAKTPHVLVLNRAFALMRVDYKPEEYASLHRYFGQISGFDRDQIVLKAAGVGNGSK